MPVLNGEHIAPTQRLHFQALHPLSFLCICTLDWCKHFTLLAVAQNFCKFPFTSLCGIGVDEVVCRPVLDRAPFLPTQGLHFQALHYLSFLFICTFPCCYHCT